MPTPRLLGSLLPACTAILSCLLATSCGSSDSTSDWHPCAACGKDASGDGADAATYDAIADSSNKDGDAKAPDAQKTDADSGVSDADSGVGLDADATMVDSPADAEAAVADGPGEAGETGIEDTGVTEADAQAITDASVEDSGAVDSGYNDVVINDSGPKDTSPIDTGPPETSTGVITGGPCISGAAGKTAYRIKWIDAGGNAQVVYEVNGLPDHSKDHAAAYGYSMYYTPEFGDPYLGEGGLVLDSSCFVDIELSTVGLSSISSITLSIYGRSYNTTASGSFDWQTFEDVGAAPYGSVSNSAPYEWYGTDMTTGMSPGNGNVLLRIKSGPPSDSLVVNRIEICMEAD